MRTYVSVVVMAVALILAGIVWLTWLLIAWPWYVWKGMQRATRW